MNSRSQMFSGTRKAAVAGYFYPQNAAELRQTINTYLDGAATDANPPAAIIAPHAGYIYSGPVAARAYAHFATADNAITRVILLGPAHRVYLRGLALCSACRFETPLGQIRVDIDSAADLMRHPDVSINDEAHRLEHSLEVHLPFLQYLFNDFVLLPLVVGDADPDTVADVIEQAWDGANSLVIVSSDLSHYHPYEIATVIDRRTADAIEALDNHHIGPEQACGYMPLGGLLTIARNRHMQVVNYDLRNSGDTAGDRQRVVGYGAWGLY